jgi:hypothetical protein
MERRTPSSAESRRESRGFSYTEIRVDDSCRDTTSVVPIVHTQKESGRSARSESQPLGGAALSALP